jgi:hypothetical protein
MIQYSREHGKGGKRKKGGKKKEGFDWVVGWNLGRK